MSRSRGSDANAAGKARRTGLSERRLVAGEIRQCMNADDSSSIMVGWHAEKLVKDA
jgi:hypothetical protein